ncbi:MAG TPA: DUF4268 domain-containing protein [Solirubrobacteraceae bacterium]|jgi:hypothetical protein
MLDPTRRSAAAEIAKIDRLPLRHVWPHEALAFTTWLEHNIEVLNEALGFVIANVERERAAGSFSVDLVGEDAAGNAVVIENQLERSDHEHLGKLITYLAAFEAKAAVWIVSDPRPEHVGAITWLNEAGSDASFFLVKVEAIRIADSPPAPLLTLITGPSAETRQVGAHKQERAERHDHRQAFWTSLLERARGRHHPHANVSPGTDSWLEAGSGMSGVHFTYTIRERDASVQLLIEGSDADTNLRIFDQLAMHRAEVEAEFGGSLNWERLEGRKKCAIGVTLEVGGRRDEDRWPVIQDAMLETMLRLERALRPRIQALRAA